jgi:hypothetical protein
MRKYVFAPKYKADTIRINSIFKVTLYDENTDFVIFYKNDLFLYFM